MAGSPDAAWTRPVTHASAASRRLAHGEPSGSSEKDQACSMFTAKNSTGPGASSSSRPARSPVRPMAPSSPPGARPPSSPPSFPPSPPKAGQDFFPLTVNYQEKAFAAGRIPGGYFKREGRPSERETLVSRLIDRPIRPLFPDGYRCDTQVIITVLSHDLENDPDVLAMVAASAALTLSGVPFMGPVGAARVGIINGALKLNPTVEEMKTSSLDLVVAGTADAVLMVELEAKELSEETMLEAVMTGHRGFQPVINAIIRLAERAAKDPRELVLPDHSEVAALVSKIAEAELREAYKITVKQDRYAAVDAVKAKVSAEIFPEGRGDEFHQGGSGRSLQGAPGQGRPLERPRHGRAHRRPRREDRAPDRRRSRRPPAHPRLGPLHPRRDAGAGRRDARHRRRRAICRLARGDLQGALPAPLQLPSLQRRRDGPNGFARPSRNRPWQARVARHPSDAAGSRRVPLHAARRLGDHRVRMARRRWRRSAALRSR